MAKRTYHKQVVISGVALVVLTFVCIIQLTTTSKDVLGETVNGLTFSSLIVGDSITVSGSLIGPCLSRPLRYDGILIKDMRFIAPAASQGPLLDFTRASIKVWREGVPLEGAIRFVGSPLPDEIYFDYSKPYTYPEKDETISFEVSNIKVRYAGTTMFEAETSGRIGTAYACNKPLRSLATFSIGSIPRKVTPTMTPHPTQTTTYSPTIVPTVKPEATPTPVYTSCGNGVCDASESAFLCNVDCKPVPNESSFLDKIPYIPDVVKKSYNNTFFSLLLSLFKRK